MPMVDIRAPITSRLLAFKKKIALILSVLYETVFKWEGKEFQIVNVEITKN